MLAANNNSALNGAFNLGAIMSFLPKDPDHILMIVDGFNGRSLFKVDLGTGVGELAQGHEERARQERTPDATHHAGRTKAILTGLPDNQKLALTAVDKFLWQYLGPDSVRPRPPFSRSNVEMKLPRRDFMRMPPPPPRRSHSCHAALRHARARSRQATA